MYLFYYNIIIIKYYYCKFYNELDDGKSVEEGRDKARQRSGQGPHSSLGANGNDNGHHWNKIIKIWSILRFNDLKFKDY